MSFDLMIVSILANWSRVFNDMVDTIPGFNQILVMAGCLILMFIAWKVFRFGMNQRRLREIVKAVDGSITFSRRMDAVTRSASTNSCPFPTSHQTGNTETSVPLFESN